MIFWKLLLTLAAIGTAGPYIPPIPQAGAEFNNILGVTHELLAYPLLLWLVIAFGAVVLFAVTRRLGWLLLAVVVVATNVIELAPFFVPRLDANGPKNDSFSLMVIDVRNTAPDQEVLSRLLSADTPDVIAVLGVNTAWSDLLVRLHKTYPEPITMPLEGGDGIALLSRMRHGGGEMQFLQDPRIPTISGLIEATAGSVRIIATAARVVLTPNDFGVRQAHLAKLARLVREDLRPTIVIGGFATTPWTAGFHEFTHNASLNFAGHGFGLEGTWPVVLSRGLLPFSQILTTSNIATQYYGVTEGAGLKSTPVIGDFRVVR